MADLKNRTLTSLLWDLGGNLSTHGVRFVISIFLARLLSPDDFGLIGMALVFINLSNIFIDIGFGAALIQRKELDEGMRSSVFYYNLLASLVIAVLFILVAPWIGAFYEKPEITTLVKWLAIGIPLNALTIVHVSLLTRKMQFKALSIRTFLAGLVSGIVGIAMALNGWSYMSLVGQHLTAGLVSLIALWGASEWRPKPIFSWSSLQELSGFSRYIFYSKSLSTLVMQLDTLAVGKLFSAATLGFYSRARSLNQLIVIYTSGSINKVFFPVLSKLQDQPNELSRIYLRTISILSLLLFGLSGLLIFSGEAIVIGLFGEQWKPTVVIFQVLMLRAFNYPINAVIVKTFLATGNAAENFRHSIIRLSIQSSTLLVAYFMGFNYFLLALVLSSYLGTFYNNVIVSRLLNIPLLRQLRNIYDYFFLFLLAAILPGLLWWQLESSLFMRGLCCSALFGFSYTLLCWLFKRADLDWARQQITEKLLP